jgi:hypothetical protein
VNMIGLLLVLAGICIALFLHWLLGVIIAAIGVVILIASAVSTRF